MSEKTTNLSAFKRVLGYVWPQWPSLVALFFWAAMIAVMFSASFLTIIPLLKVMMEEEGLHAWIDRKVCNARYGIDFYVPGRNELYDTTSDVAKYLLINRVDGGKWGAENGLQRGDRIVNIAIGDSLGQENSIAVMLELLATSESEQPMVWSILRTDAQGNSESLTLHKSVPNKPFYADWMQWPVSFIPRSEKNEDMLKAMIVVILALTAVTFIRCWARFYQSYLAEKVVSVANAKLREDVFHHALYMPVGFFATRGTSDTTSRIIGDVAQSGKGIKILFGKTIREPLVAIGAMTAAFTISWELSLIFLTSAPAVIGVIAIFGKKMKRAMKKSLVSTAQLLGRIQEVMNALRVVKVYNRQPWEAQAYEKKNREFLKYSLRMSKIDAATSPTMDAMGMVAAVSVILIGAVWVTHNKMQPSAFFALLACLGGAAESVRKVSDVWNMVQQANAAAERVFAVMDEPKEREAPNAFAMKPLHREIEFRNIVFTYPGAQQPALNGIDLTVPAGQTVAIVGSNGSGKTTLVNLLPRFYDPDSGQILIDGQDIHQATFYSLRDQISMVTQNVVTFNDTIANNIAYSKPDATRDEVIAAAKRAYAHEFITTLPKGYDSMIGELSSGFSGGQLQRIVIARAILKNPRILIFDEAMSQIDAESEAKIHAALGDIMKGRTCFLIAHRFSTVISADRIIVMDKGRIVADGRHQDLIQHCQVYKNLYETQLMSPQ
ncbi:ABC transporter ATP-binding protein [Anaerohalosphaeraceae bacterium U12dextr]